MAFELDLTCIKIKCYTKFQINMSKHVGEKCGKLWRTDGRRPGRTDGHHHTIYVPSEDGRIISGAQLVPIGIPTICWYTMRSNCTFMFSTKKVKASHNSAQELDQHLYESHFSYVLKYRSSEISLHNGSHSGRMNYSGTPVHTARIPSPFSRKHDYKNDEKVPHNISHS